MVERLTPPVPLELLGFGLNATLARLGPVKLRAVPVSPDGGIIADYTGDFDDPAAFASELSQAVGVVEHGFFPANMVSEVIVGRGERAERIEVTPQQPRRQ
jgi:ribose 5-phosphate isomerase A